jgi:hypothetical protein
MKNLDIHTAVQMAVFLAAAGGILAFLIGVRSINTGRRLPFFRKRQDRIAQGWRTIMAGVLMGVLAFSLSRFAEPIVYNFYPVTPTITLTPTTSITPTVSLTPTLTITPTITNTPSVTNTPFMPLKVQSGFTSSVTPKPDAIFSSIRFARSIDKNNLPVDPAAEFTNPVGHLYGTFSFDGMINDEQWSALWYRGTELVYYESTPWKGGTGGFGYTDWNPPPGAWLPGQYEVQVFIDTEYKVSGFFTVVGEPVKTTGAASTAGANQTPSVSPTRTPWISPTELPTNTPRPSTTPAPPTVTNTSKPVHTYPPTLTPTPTMTRLPRATESPTPTERPTRTPG